MRRRPTHIPTQSAATLESPVAGIGEVSVRRHLVPECQLGIGGEILGGSHDHHVADERAPHVADARVVDV